MTETAVLASPSLSKRKGLQVPLTLTLIAWCVRLFSVVNMLNAAFAKNYELLPFVSWLSSWMPFEISEGHRYRMFLTSMLLMYLASGLQRGKQLAWWLTILGLGCGPLVHWGRGLIWENEMLNFALIGVLIYYRKEYVAGSDRRSVRSALIGAIFLIVPLIFFGAIRLNKLRDQLVGDRSWIACVQTSCELVLSHTSHTQHPATPRAEKLFTLLRTGGTGIAFVALTFLLRPVLAPSKELSRKRLEHVKKLIEDYGTDPFNAYALLEDKRYFFSENDSAVIPYAYSRDVVVALVDPIGPVESRPQAIQEFVQFCRRQDWEPVFYAASEEMRAGYNAAGLSLFKIGEDARLQAEDFTLKGTDFQNLRTLCNRAKKLEITYRWYDASQGIDRNLERQLASISRKWLRMKRAQEMSFDMGAFSIDDIRRNGAGIAFDSSGVPLAFATWRPFRGNQGRTLDLMRYSPDARNVMDFVLAESIIRFRSLQINDISLGMAPMANTENPSNWVAEDRVVNFLFHNLNQIYGYKPLFEFKRKYRPRWRGRFLVYRRGANLPMIAWALVRVHAADGIMKFLLS